MAAVAAVAAFCRRQLHPLIAAAVAAAAAAALAVTVAGYNSHADYTASDDKCRRLDTKQSGL